MKITRNVWTWQLFHFRTRESPAPLNIPTPTPASIRLQSTSESKDVTFIKRFFNFQTQEHYNWHMQTIWEYIEHIKPFENCWRFQRFFRCCSNVVDPCLKNRQTLGCPAAKVQRCSSNVPVCLMTGLRVSVSMVSDDQVSKESGAQVSASGAVEY